MTSKVRVLLLTYRRTHMIGRALESLVEQDFKDWVCEVHNDWPDDAAAIQQIVSSLGDERFEVLNHPATLGGTRSFNRPFESRHVEPLFAILEDDNYWHRSANIRTSSRHGAINKLELSPYFPDELRMVFPAVARGRFPPEILRSGFHSDGVRILAFDQDPVDKSVADGTADEWQHCPRAPQCKVD